MIRSNKKTTFESENFSNDLKQDGVSYQQRWFYWSPPDKNLQNVVLDQREISLGHQTEYD